MKGNKVYSFGPITVSFLYYYYYYASGQLQALIKEFGPSTTYKNNKVTLALVKGTCLTALH